MLGNVRWRFSKLIIRAPNGFDPDQDRRRFVGPDLDPNCLQMVSIDTSKIRVNNMNGLVSNCFYLLHDWQRNLVCWFGCVLQPCERAMLRCHSGCWGGSRLLHRYAETLASSRQSQSWKEKTGVTRTGTHSTKVLPLELSTIGLISLVAVEYVRTFLSLFPVFFFFLPFFKTETVAKLLQWSPIDSQSILSHCRNIVY